MNSVALPSESSVAEVPAHRGDRIGVIASVLCAIHCAVTPILMLLAPAFGSIWAHPASHWLMALLVVPLAIVMILKGFARHQRKWVVACGVLGVLFVLLGAIAPYMEKSSSLSLASADPEPSSKIQEAAITEAGPCAEEETCEEESCGSCEESASAAAAESCEDTCCPSIQTDEATGEKRLHIPPASILTTLGGLFLIVAHIGNLCPCHGCKEKDDSSN